MSIRIAAGAVVVLALSISGGCWNSAPPRVAPPEFDANAPQKAMEMYDTDKNGSIEGKELDKVPALKLAFKGNKVTVDDLTKQLDGWKGSRLGRQSVRVTVLHKGKPLADADVTYEPEPFLGSGVPTCSGKTDADGAAAISAPMAEGLPSGVPPGYYRVKITKAGESIPKQYNAETTLGAEVGGFVQAGGRAERPSSGGIRYDLMY